MFGRLFKKEGGKRTRERANRICWTLGWRVVCSLSLANAGTAGQPEKEKCLKIENVDGKHSDDRQSSFMHFHSSQRTKKRHTNTPVNSMLYVSDAAAREMPRGGCNDKMYIGCLRRWLALVYSSTGRTNG